MDFLRRGAGNRRFDQWNFGYDNDGDSRFGNCTSYVAWRLNESRSGPGAWTELFLQQPPGGHRRSPVRQCLRVGRPGRRKSATLRPRSRQLVRLPGGTVPLPSEFVRHVAVVRSVEPNGSIVVEQSAWDTYDLKIETISPTSPRYPTGFLHLLPSR